MPKDTTWLTKTQAAEYLDVHPETIYRLYRQGDIERSGTGKNARYSQEELNKYIGRHKPWYTPKLSA